MTPCNLRPGLLTVGASALFVPAELLRVILSVHCLWFLCGGRMGNRLIPRCLANRPFWPPFNLSGVLQEGFCQLSFCKLHLRLLHKLLKQAVLVMGGVRSGLIHWAGWKGRWFPFFSGMLLPLGRELDNFQSLFLVGFSLLRALQGDSPHLQVMRVKGKKGCSCFLLLYLFVKKT